MSSLASKMTCLAPSAFAAVNGADLSLNKRSASKLNEGRRNLNESRTSGSNRSLQSGQAPRGNAVELDRWAVLAGIKK